MKLASALAASLIALAASVSDAFVFGPYKDVTVNMDWNTNVISTSVTGSRQSVPTVMKAAGAGNQVVTWSFATGTCGSETWAGIKASDLAAANVQAWAAAGQKYIIGTGGAAGSFRCTSDADFTAFINRYKSSSLVGIDFDMEAGQSQADVENLVSRAIAAQKQFPELRFSFTLACFGGSANPILGDIGIRTMNAIKSLGMKNFFINLMTMDYGSATPNNCVIDSATNECHMGKSAIRAATSLKEQFGVPFSQIEVTPMIGGNDTPKETFTLEDVQTLAAFVKSSGLAGFKFWSLDRDVDCPPGSASSTCNSYGKSGVLGFTKAIGSQFTGVPAPTPSPTGSNPTPTVTPSTATPTTQRPTTKNPTVVPSTAKPTTKSPTTTAPTDGSSSQACAKSLCKGCLWTYAAGTQCLATYPKVSCDLYKAEGFTWCD